MESTFSISFKSFLFQKKLLVLIEKMDIVSDFNAEAHKFFKNKLAIYGFIVNKVISEQFIYLRAKQCITTCNLCLYELIGEKDEDIKILEILDMAVAKEIRNKGIGTQLLGVIDKIARENNCCYITGDLQEDRIDEPLNQRKFFFEKNGFGIFYNKCSEFSGWIIKKSI